MADTLLIDGCAVTLEVAMGRAMETYGQIQLGRIDQRKLYAKLGRELIVLREARTPGGAPMFPYGTWEEWLGQYGINLQTWYKAKAAAENRKRRLTQNGTKQDANTSCALQSFREGAVRKTGGDTGDTGVVGKPPVDPWSWEDAPQGVEGPDLDEDCEVDEGDEDEGEEGDGTGETGGAGGGDGTNGTYATNGTDGDLGDGVQAGRLYHQDRGDEAFKIGPQLTLEALYEKKRRMVALSEACFRLAEGGDEAAEGCIDRALAELAKARAA